MITESTPGTGDPSKAHPSRARGRPKAAQTTVTEYRLENSLIAIIPGPAGPIARIDRHGTIDYAGPLPDGTLDALAEVAIHA